jgi:hypothetical protein
MPHDTFKAEQELTERIYSQNNRTNQINRTFVSGNRTWCVPAIHCCPLLNSHVLGKLVVEEERCITLKSTFPIIPNMSSKCKITVR